MNCRWKIEDSIRETDKEVGLLRAGMQCACLYKCRAGETKQEHAGQTVETKLGTLGSVMEFISKIRSST